MARRDSIPMLSKSRFQSGMQCHRQLYYKLYEPESATKPSAGQQARFDEGTEVGLLARGYFPGGIAIDEEYRQHDAAMAHTARVLADDAVPVLYEAAFRHDDVRVRADLLVRTGRGAFDLVEVKSSTQVKPEHLWDVVIQTWVVRGSGLNLRRSGLLHINRDYV